MSPAARNKITVACKAMENLGITTDITKSALKYLVGLYNNNWELIEDDNYMVLVDYLLDGNKNEDNEAPGNEVESHTTLSNSQPPSEGSHPRDKKTASPPPLCGSSLELENNMSERMPDHEAGPSQLDCILDVSPLSSWKEENPREPPIVNNQSPKGSNSIQSMSQSKKTNAKRRKSAAYVDPRNLKLSARRFCVRSKENNSEATAGASSLDFKKTSERHCTNQGRPHFDCLDVIDLLSSGSDRTESVAALEDCRLSKRFKYNKNLESKDAVPSASSPDKSNKSCQSQPSTSPVASSILLNIARTASPKGELVPCMPGLDASTGSSMNQHSKNLDSNGAVSKCKTKGITDYFYNEPASVKMTSVSENLPSSASLKYLSDITQGKEEVNISLLGPSIEPLPNFHYIAQNIVSQDAFVSFALARISDEDCCFNCSGDCLSLSVPCHCARETGGEFAYMPGGLLRENFLEESISMNQNPQKNHFYYCKNCPLERSKKKKVPDPCKGHVIRKFVKECWSKCGCSRWCGNRVVQRGITAKLQVFWTPGGKGWGLQTLEALPKGAFVCEYVGEIVTNTELHDRNVQRRGKKHTYPVLLDADWGSEHVLKDEEALCLDATFYGNVGRFVNHRCFDSNLVEIPVEVETPDRHYYHLAFFTTRRVEPLEELTWDYGIDFSDKNHPVKAFKCLCGSKVCREAKSAT